LTVHSLATRRLGNSDRSLLSIGNAWAWMKSDLGLTLDGLLDDLAQAGVMEQKS
jgi:hypothetical protein